MNELITIDINGNQHMLGFKPLSQDLYETIEPYMGHDFARYVQDKYARNSFLLTKVW